MAKCVFGVFLLQRICSRSFPHTSFSLHSYSFFLFGTNESNGGYYVVVANSFQLSGKNLRKDVLARSVAACRKQTLELMGSVVQSKSNVR